MATTISQAFREYASNLELRNRRPKNQLVCAPQKFRRYTLSFDNVL